MYRKVLTKKRIFKKDSFFFMFKDGNIIYTKKENSCIESEKYLYYVACTRAQHQLIIYNQNEEL